jgi:hypothetical protein
MDQRMDQRTRENGRRHGHGRAWVAGAVVIMAGWFLVTLAAWSDSRAGTDNPPAVNGGTTPGTFDHDATSFPLRGGHRILKCEQCHLAGQYKTLPTRCDECHTGQLIYGKPNNHVLTSQNCDACHTERDWTFYHNLVATSGQCSTCHNGQTATGKPMGHVPTTAECDVCHTTRNWSFSHNSALTAGQCDSCHNGQIAEGKPAPPAHVSTTGQCDLCHTTRNWMFNHTPALTAGQCDTCHNGQIATGKPAPPAHVSTTGQCDLCHKSTTAWTFSHDPSMAGQCSTCHNGQIAEGKPMGHFGTTLQCDMCHTTTGWTPVNLSFHVPTRLIGAHTVLDCSACHVISTGAVIYRDGTTYGFCANCHTRDYRAGAEDHRSIALDANCANCHNFTVFSGN